MFLYTTHVWPAINPLKWFSYIIAFLYYVLHIVIFHRHSTYSLALICMSQNSYCDLKSAAKRLWHQNPFFRKYVRKGCYHIMTLMHDLQQTPYGNTLHDIHKYVFYIWNELTKAILRSLYNMSIYAYNWYCRCHAPYWIRKYILEMSRKNLNGIPRPYDSLVGTLARPNVILEGTTWKWAPLQIGDSTDIQDGYFCE